MCEPKRMLFLGGSITAGASASSYEKAWASLCFKGINKPLFAGNAEMYNASISGTGSVLAAVRLKQHVLPYKPDLRLNNGLNKSIDMDADS